MHVHRQIVATLVVICHAFEFCDHTFILYSFICPTVSSVRQFRPVATVVPMKSAPASMKAVVPVATAPEPVAR